MSTTQLDSFLTSAKAAIDELGPAASEEGEFLKLDDGAKISLEFRLDKKAEAVQKDPFKEGDAPRKQIRFYTFEIDAKGKQLRKVIWDVSKRDSNLVYRTMVDEQTNKLEIKRLGTGRETRYNIYPFHAKGA